MIQYLVPYLSEKADELDKYSTLFEALAAINDTSLDQTLLEYIEQYPLENLSNSLIESFISLDTKIVKQWLKKILTSPIPSETKNKILLRACEHSKLDDNDFVKLLQSKDEKLQRKYIDTIRLQIRNGIQPSKVVTQLIIDITFLESVNTVPAFTALLDINPQNITQGKIDSTYLKKYRKFIKNKDEYTALSAIMILADSKDVQSFETILKFAVSIKQDMSIRIESIRALANYYQQNNSLIIDTLHSIYKDETKQTDRYLATIVLETLAKIDINEISEYLNIPENYDVLTKICSTENVLLFEDSYYDKFGIQHHWDKEEDIPMLDASLKACDQLEQLKIVCQYLLDKKHAKKTGRKNTPLIPLFNKSSYTHDDHIDSVDANTGTRLLKGMYINPKQAQLLMDWIKYKFPTYIIE